MFFFLFQTTYCHNPKLRTVIADLNSNSNVWQVEEHALVWDVIMRMRTEVQYAYGGNGNSNGLLDLLMELYFHCTHDGSNCLHVHVHVHGSGGTRTGVGVVRSNVIGNNKAVRVLEHIVKADLKNAIGITLADIQVKLYNCVHIYNTIYI